MQWLVIDASHTACMAGQINYYITMTSQHIIEEFHISANKVSF